MPTAAPKMVPRMRSVALLKDAPAFAWLIMKMVMYAYEACGECMAFTSTVVTRHATTMRAVARQRSDVGNNSARRNFRKRSSHVTHEMTPARLTGQRAMGWRAVDWRRIGSQVR